MKKPFSFSLAVLMVVAGAVAAQAVAIDDPWQKGGGGEELDLFDIV